MSGRLLALVSLCAWSGVTLLLSELRWFQRIPLTERLAPYSPAERIRTRAPAMSLDSFSEVLGPLARSVGEAASSLLRIDDDLLTRLSRIHSPLDPTSFRLRQLGWAVLTAGAALAVATFLAPPPAIAALLVLGSPVLAFLVPEQQLASAGERWERRVFLELPVVAEQLGMLLSAGYSLGSALNRLAERGKGASGRDLQRLAARIRLGTTEVEALREWRDLVRVEGLDRLVAVLSLNQDAGDLSRLVAEEARSIRRDAQRELIEAIERRAQLVWIPVTVSALLPGSILLLVPFLEAMRLFTNP